MRILIILFIVLFSYQSKSNEVNVYFDENIDFLKTSKLKKLKTNEIEKILFNTVTFGFYNDSAKFESHFSPNTSGKQARFSTTVRKQTYTGFYKVEKNKVCFLIDGKKNWECSFIYKKNKKDKIYYWGLKKQIYAKATHILSSSKVKKLKEEANLNWNSYLIEIEKILSEINKKNYLISKSDKLLRSYQCFQETLKNEIKYSCGSLKQFRNLIKTEEKRIIADQKKAEEKRIADQKKAEEKRIADQKKAEEKRIADQKKAEEKRIAKQKILDKKPETIQFGITDEGGLKGKGLYCQKNDLLIYIDFKGIDEIAYPDDKKGNLTDLGAVDVYWLKRKNLLNQAKLNISQEYFKEIKHDLVKKFGKKFFIFNKDEPIKIKNEYYYHLYSLNHQRTNYKTVYPGFIDINIWKDKNGELPKNGWIRIDRTNLKLSLKNLPKLNSKSHNKNVNHPYLSGEKNIFPYFSKTSTFRDNYMLDQHFFKNTSLGDYFGNKYSFFSDALNRTVSTDNPRYLGGTYIEGSNTEVSVICKVEKKNEEDVKEFIQYLSNKLNEEINLQIEDLKNIINNMKGKNLI